MPQARCCIGNKFFLKINNKEQAGMPKEKFSGIEIGFSKKLRMFAGNMDLRTKISSIVAPVIKVRRGLSGASALVRI